MAPAPARLWTSDQDDRLCAMVARQTTRSDIATALGVSRNAVTGRIDRLRAAGDPRIPPAGRSPIADKTPKRTASQIARDRLAELMAQGCPSLVDAAYRLRASLDQVERTWSGIRRDLGPQAS